MSNPFKKITDNAENNKSKMYEQVPRLTKLVKSEQCETCGAPRPKNSNLVKCAYCHTSFMDIDENIKSDA